MATKIKIGAMMACALILCSCMAQVQHSVSPQPATPIASGHIRTPVALGDASTAMQTIAFKSMAEPTYPRAEECEGTTGTVVLLITIDEIGDPIDIKIEHSSHNRHLDGAVMDASRKWKFEPIVRNGKATQCVVRVAVDFEPTKDRCALI